MNACGPLENGGIPLICRNHTVEPLQFVHLVQWHAQFPDFHRARVVQCLAARFGPGMVAAETELGVRWRREFVDFIAGGQSYVEGVGVTRRTLEFKRELSRLLVSRIADDLLPKTRGRTRRRPPAFLA